MFSSHCHLAGTNQVAHFLAQTRSRDWSPSQGLGSRRDPHHADGVEGGVSPHAEVRAGHIVGDRGRDDHEGDAELIILLPALHQLQAPRVSLRRQSRGGRNEGEKAGVGAGGEEEMAGTLTSKPPIMTRP